LKYNFVELSSLLIIEKYVIRLAKSKVIASSEENELSIKYSADQVVTRIKHTLPKLSVVQYKNKLNNTV